MASVRDSVGNTAAEWGPWWCCAHPAASVADPEQLTSAASAWLPAVVPGTVAAACAAAGVWSLDRHFDFDVSDWWYRTTFKTSESPCYLCFDGLATRADVWLNGQHILTSDNMFRASRVEITPHVRSHNELILAFRSLNHALGQKRPRPRWKTNLVNHQQLRWHRTTLLGRIPGWSPPVAPVGPWRDVRVESGSVLVSDLCLTTSVANDVGIVRMHARMESRSRLDRATFHVGASNEAAVQFDADGVTLRAEIRIPNPSLWWPHTHGDQPLLDCSLVLTAGADRVTLACGRVGFRDLRGGEGEPFSLSVNGVPVYCRGACWTVSDIVSLDGTSESLARDLRLARDAGVNMLRVGGTMTYESDAFYRLCDELGIMVWQDFMFANMDYPVEDADFAANIAEEANQQIGRLAKHPCVAVYCGNSEIEQQAAMLGIPESSWRNRWFGEQLPGLIKQHHPGVVYVPSTPSGGAMPFHLRQGVAHYFGVGAYHRSPADVRKDDVGFSPECLGFANIPEPATLNTLGDGETPPVHDPRWKERVPRDTGAGWDFDDVRDHYLKLRFDVDPVRLRSADPERYLQLSRVVPGEMMAQVYAEWRSAHSRNRGGLIWYFKDLWPGAGWGIVDSRGLPKATYYYLRRSWQPRQIAITNEGLDGLHLHIINETADEFHGHVEFVLLKEQHIVVARREVACRAAPRATVTLASDAILDGFYDAAYAYRFGPPKHDVAIATLLDARRQAISEAHEFPVPREPRHLPNAQLTATTARLSDGIREVTLQADRFLQSVSFDVKDFHPDDNYFHLSPLRPKVVRFAPTKPNVERFSGYAEALNLPSRVKIV